MQDHVAKINHDPAVAGIALFFAFSFMFNADFVDGSIGEGVKHAVAGAGANDEVVGKRRNFLNVEQNDVFAFFVFKGVDYVAGKVQCIQSSPQGSGK